MSSSFLLYGTTEQSAALRHEVPIALIDPLLYADLDGRTYILSSQIERDRIARARPDVVLVDIADLGWHELLQSGLTEAAIRSELAVGMARRIDVREAVVDFDFPLGIADRLRREGIVLTIDQERIAARRRVKSDHEIEGIRRAQRAAEAGMEAAAELLRLAVSSEGRLLLDDRPLLAETIREAIREACHRLGSIAPADIIVASVWQGFGHEAGFGPLPSGLPIQIDLWPRDELSNCWADMTRTFVVGAEPPPEIVAQHGLVQRVLETVRAAIKPGVLGSELHGLACDVFEAAGYRTQRTGPGDDATEGFQFSLGHGVGLSVHEPPALGMAGHEQLVAGDVIAVEPGLWVDEMGGVRLEDLLLVTDEGASTLTRYPYGLHP